MDYDFSGMYYRLFCPSMIVLAISVVCFLLELKGRKNGEGKRVVDRKRVWTHVGCICFCLFVTGFYVYRIQLQDVKSYTGEYVSQRHNTREAPPLPLTMEYRFENPQGKEKSFYLDVFSKRRIWAEDFEVGQEYLIYYEATMDVIVAVEEVNSQITE